MSQNEQARPQLDPGVSVLDKGRASGRIQVVNPHRCSIPIVRRVVLFSIQSYKREALSWA